MAAKYLIVLCAQAFLVQSTFAQRNKGAVVTGNSWVEKNIRLAGGGSAMGLGKAGSGIRGLGNVGVVSGLSNYNIVSSGPLLVTSISPIGPSGLAVATENAIEGKLAVTGQLPYLSAVAFDGALPTAGSGLATCGCGDGKVAIASEGLGRPPIYY